MRTFFVSTELNQTANIIKNEITGRSVSGTVVDEYILQTPNGNLGVMVFEKYFYRTNNRASLTVTIDNFCGNTRVHICSAGSSQSIFFRVDWGASERFENSVYKVLKMYEKY